MACAEFFRVPVRPASESPAAARIPDTVFSQAVPVPALTSSRSVTRKARPTMVATSSGQNSLAARVDQRGGVLAEHDQLVPAPDLVVQRVVGQLAVAVPGGLADQVFPDLDGPGDGGRGVLGHVLPEPAGQPAELGAAFLAEQEVPAL